MPVSEAARRLKESANKARSGEKLHIVLGFRGEAVHIFIVKGLKPGPSVWIQAALHGDENDGTAACIEAAGELEGSLEKGTVIFCPLVNTTAFYAERASSPVDGRNLNRMGNSQEDTFSSDYFKWLLSLISSSASYALDLHGGGFGLEVCPFATVPAGNEELFHRMEALAGFLNIDYILKTVGKGFLVEALAGLGVPAILLENGGGSLITDRAVKAHKENIFRFLAALGMIGFPCGCGNARQERGGGSGAVPVLEEAINLYINKSGVLVSAKPVGTRLKKGEEILRVLDRKTFEPESLVCPAEGGVLLSVRSQAFVRPGSYGAYIGLKKSV